MIAREKRTGENLSERRIEVHKRNKSTKKNDYEEVKCQYIMKNRKQIQVY